jgi:hypothetical protein
LTGRLIHKRSCDVLRAPQRFRLLKRWTIRRFPRADSASQKRTQVPENDLYSGVTEALNRYQKGYEEEILLEFGTAGIGRFSGPILMYESILVGKEGAAAGRIEHLRICIQGIPRRRGGHSEDITVLVPNC